MNPLRSGFGTYLQTQKLAKMLLSEAEIRLKKGDHPEKAIQYVIDAQCQMLIALNNIAQHAYFKRRRIRGGRVR